MQINNSFAALITHAIQLKQLSRYKRIFRLSVFDFHLICRDNWKFNICITSNKRRSIFIFNYYLLIFCIYYTKIVYTCIIETCLIVYKKLITKKTSKKLLLQLFNDQIVYLNALCHARKNITAFRLNALVFYFFNFFLFLGCVFS